jgi:hypothetical protein
VRAEVKVHDNEGTIFSQIPTYEQESPIPFQRVKILIMGKEKWGWKTYPQGPGFG